jgi:hypothetical protein
MRKPRGLLGMLSTIAIGVSLAAMSASSASAQDAQVIIDAFPPEIIEQCGSILEHKTVEAFNDDPFAVAARDNESDVCHELALRWWAMLSGEEDTGAIGEDPGGGGGGGYDLQ